MASLPDWVPIRWLCGPLDVSQQQDTEGFTAKSKETLQAWLDPSVLDVLRSTPVNCVVLNWAAGLPADAEQQKALAPLIARGKAAGLSFAGMVDGEANRAAAVASAGTAGLDAVVLSGETPGAGLPVVPLAARPQLPWGSSSPVLAAKGNAWPGVAAQGLADQGWRTGQDAAAAGPTADPWIDSNGWFLRLARVYAPSKRIWLAFEPPRGSRVLPVASYLRAISDTYTDGGRWILALDESLRAGLARKEQSALDSWKTIGDSLAFFEGRRGWLEFQPLGAIGVISDFSGADEMVGTETLNLIARRSLPFRIIEKSKAVETPFTGLKALICVDEALPAPALRKKLTAFAEQGGALLVSQSWKGEGGTPNGQEHPRLDLRTLGKGKLAVSKSDPPDPYMVARDIHVLLGRANDLVRFYNISAFIAGYTAAPDGSMGLLQMTNYATRGTTDLVTVWFPEQYRSARLWEIGAAAPKPLSMYPENTGMDVELPVVTTYVGVEVSKSKLA